MTPEAAIGLIAHELALAKKKHPTWPEDQVHAVAIVVEEAGESMRAALNLTYHGGSIDDLRHELAQTGAMIMRALVNLDDEKDSYRCKDCGAKLANSDISVRIAKNTSTIDLIARCPHCYALAFTYVKLDELRDEHGLQRFSGSPVR